MSIHDLYNKRKEEFQKYTIEAKIHEEHISELVSDLKAQLAVIKGTVVNIPESQFKEKLVVALNDIEKADDIGSDLSVAVKFREILETLASELESKIQVMLDGPV